MAIRVKGAHFPQEIMLLGVRWDVAYPLSYRHVAALMKERGVALDHATINRGVIQDSPLLEEALHRRQRPVWVSWRLDETDMQVQGAWRALSRAVDQHGPPIDFLLTAQRDEQAAKRFLTKASRRHGVPEQSTIDGSAAKKAAIERYNEAHGPAIAIRQVTYLNTIVEPAHRGVQRVTRPMVGCKSFEAAQSTFTGIALMHMLRKGQRTEGSEQGRSAAEQFDALAA